MGVGVSGGWAGGKELDELHSDQLFIIIWEQIVSKLLICCNFVQSVDPLRKQAFRHSYLGLLDLQNTQVLQLLTETKKAHHLSVLDFRVSGSNLMMPSL